MFQDSGILFENGVFRGMFADCGLSAAMFKLNTKKRSDPTTVPRRPIPEGSWCAAAGPKKWEEVGSKDDYRATCSGQILSQILYYC